MASSGIRYRTVIRTVSQLDQRQIRERPRSTLEEKGEQQQGSAQVRTHLKAKLQKKEHDNVELSPGDRDRDETDNRKKADRKRIVGHNERVKDSVSHYELLGECFIHTKMDGEAMVKQNEKSIPSQVFELR